MEALHECRCGHIFPGILECPRCHQKFPVTIPTSSPTRTPHAALVLVFDGGGIRGVSSLIIEQALMKAIKEEEKRQRGLPPGRRNSGQQGVNQETPAQEGLKRQNLEGKGKGRDEAESNVAVQQDQELTEGNNIELEPLPCEYFDFIFGTSTGGLIATMQGRLGLPITDCIKEYRRLGERIFAHPRPFHAQNKQYMRSKYDADDYRDIVTNLVDRVNGEPQPLRRHPSTFYYAWKFVKVRGKRAGRMVKKLLTRRRGDMNEEVSEEPLDESRIFRQPNNTGCKTVVIATKDAKGGAEPYLFRSYDHMLSQIHVDLHLDIDNPGVASEVSIVDVALATSAAPTIFKVVKIPSEKVPPNVPPVPRHQRFMDGGILANNPSDFAINEVTAWQMADPDRCKSTADAIGCFVSIGCGKSKWQIFGNPGEMSVLKYLRMRAAPKDIITDTRPAHVSVLRLSRRHQIPYYRFNVHEGLSNITLDEWRFKKRKLKSKRPEESTEVRKMWTFEYIVEVAKRYLEGINIKEGDTGDEELLVEEELRACAKLLVAYKLERERLKNNLHELQDQQNRAPWTPTNPADIDPEGSQSI